MTTTIETISHISPRLSKCATNYCNSVTNIFFRKEIGQRVRAVSDLLVEHWPSLAQSLRAPLPTGSAGKISRAGPERRSFADAASNFSYFCHFPVGAMCNIPRVQHATSVHHRQYR